MERRFGKHVLAIDPAAETQRIATTLAEQVRGILRRRGLVVAISGGVDSAVVASLCVRAVGRERVQGLLLPDRDSSPESLELGSEVVRRLGIDARVVSITPMLEAFGCYREQLEAARAVFPDYGEGWRCKMVLAPVTGEHINVFSLVAAAPDGTMKKARLPPEAYRRLVAAMNSKQRTRKQLEYHEADRLGYAVAGTPNRLEHDQGFFVKNGDGAADVKPIAHLYKTQVYALAEHLDVPEAIRTRPPTTDTYALAQTQDELHFPLPLREMDLVLWSKNHGVAASEVAEALGLGVGKVAAVYRDIDQKRRATRYLHHYPLYFDEIPEVGGSPECAVSPAS